MNNELKEILDFKENADYKKLSCDEIAILKDYITNLQHTEDLYNQLLKDYDELQERIDKAVEYIENGEYYIYKKTKYMDYIIANKEFLNILNGESNE